MSLFFTSLGRASSKKGRVAMLIGDMYVSKLMVYMQKVEEEKLRDREEYGNKKAMTGNEPRQQKSGSNRPQFQKQKGHAPSSSSAPAPIDRVEHHVHHSRARPTYSQVSMAR